MQYKRLNDRLIIDDLSQFNVQQIFDCGQIFRYVINGNKAVVISKDKKAELITYNDKIEIITSDIDYFENFFDLSRNYNTIKSKLSKDEFLLPCVKFGYGIRILNQDLFEMIVSFIVSANNNIKRIKNSLNYLSEHFGTNKGDYYAFPTLNQLKIASIEDYTKAGLGYRAEYMYDTIQKLTVAQLENFKNLTDEEQYKFLLSLKGIGEKVAHCILLFAMHNTQVFPVDTWINKVYNDLTKTNTTNRKEISKDLTNRYKDLSGYAQQYFFYYYRELK